MTIKVFERDYYDTELVTVSLKLPRWLLEMIDTIVNKEGFASRSELIRLAIREYIKKYRKKGAAEVQ